MAPSHGIIERLAELAAAGQPFVLVTLAEAVGSTPQDAGAKMLVDAVGLQAGTIGGGRLEQQAIAAAEAMLAEPTARPCTLVEWNLKRDVGMTCGGSVRLLFEAYHLHPWRVVVFGAGHVGQAVVRCLLLLDCRVVCIDQRPEWLERLPEVSCLERVCLEEPAAFVPQLSDTDVVICMTMGHATDLPILRAIFQAGLRPTYLGVIGSRAKREVLRRELEAAGIPAAAIDPLRCPVGLPIGGNQPGEIAISLVAEVLQVRAATTLGQHRAADSR
jgi:xanthine dehydrogenase accessory factor